MYNEVFIKGTAINLDDAALKGVTKAEKIPPHYFEHLYGDNRKEAEDELLESLKENSKKEKTSPAKGKKSGAPEVMGTGKTSEEIHEGL